MQEVKIDDRLFNFTILFWGKQFGISAVGRSTDSVNYNITEQENFPLDRSEHLPLSDCC